MLNTISPHIIPLPKLTLSYTVKQNVIYRLVNVIYIYIIIACCGKLVSYLDTITPYSENTASYCTASENTASYLLITFITTYIDVDVIFLHYS